MTKDAPENETCGIPLIDSFIKKDSDTDANKIDYAYLINGLWGCGKTWFIGNKLKSFVENKENNKKLIYCSVNGIKNIEEFISTTSLKILGMANVAKHKKEISKATSSITNFFPKGISMANTIVSTLGDTILEKCAIGKKNIVLIIDDLERLSKNVSIEDLLGEINTKFIMNGIKVIFVADESKIEDEKNGEYSKIKEKYIRRTITYSPTKDEIFDDFLKKYSFSKNLQIDFIKILTTLYSKEEQPNLRTLKFSLDLFEEFFEYQPLQLDEIIISSIFYSICEFAMMYKSGKHTTYEEFKNEATANNPEIIKDDFLIHFVYYGEINEEKYRNFIAIYENDTPKLFLQLYNYKDLEFAELKENIDKVIFNLKNKKCTINDLTYIFNITNLYNKVYPNKDFDFEALLLDSIFYKQNEKAFYDFCQHWEDFDFYEIMDIETHISLYDEYSDDFLSKIERVFDEYKFQIEENATKDFIKDLKNDKNLSYYKLSFFDLKMYCDIFELKNKELNKLSEYIRVNYEKSSLEEEIDALNDFIEICENHIKEHNLDFLKQAALENFINVLNEQLDKYK